MQDHIASQHGDRSMLHHQAFWLCSVTARNISCATHRHICLVLCVGSGLSLEVLFTHLFFLCVCFSLFLNVKGLLIMKKKDGRGWKGFFFCPCLSFLISLQGPPCREMKKLAFAGPNASSPRHDKSSALRPALRIVSGGGGVSCLLDIRGGLITRACAAQTDG